MHQVLPINRSYIQCPFVRVILGGLQMQYNQFVNESKTLRCRQPLFVQQHHLLSQVEGCSSDDHRDHKFKILEPSFALLQAQGSFRETLLQGVHTTLGYVDLCTQLHGPRRRGDKSYRPRDVLHARTHSVKASAATSQHAQSSIVKHTVFADLVS